MSLHEQLEARRAKSAESMPEYAALFDRHVKELTASRFTDGALGVGDGLPEFSLPNAAGLTVHSKSLLDYGPLAVTFYRGGWCPYCSLELQAFQEVLAAVEAEHATLVAVTPETTDFALATRDLNALALEVLHDENNALARRCGLVFRVPDYVRPAFLGLGVDLARRHGVPEWELPVPATYVSDQDGTITLAHVDVDYTNRLEPAEVVAELGRLRRRRRAVAGA